MHKAYWQAMLNHTMHKLDFGNVANKIKVTFHTCNQIQY